MTVTNQPTPLQVGTDTDWQQVSATGVTIAALKTDGTAWWWGAIAEPGQMASSVATPTPVTSPNGQPWTFLAAGGDASCGAQADGSLWCWGQNGNLANLGIGTAAIEVVGPTQLTGGPYSSASLGSFLPVAVGQDHSLWTWGGLAGNPTVSPQQIDPTPTWRAVATSYAGAQTPTTCGIHVDGSLWCKGENSYGNVGVGDLNVHPAFTQVGTATDWVAVALGGATGCAMSSSNEVSCWGLDDLGQIGDGVAPPSTAEQVAPGTTWTALAAATFGAPGFLGIQTDGSLWVWGQYEYMLAFVAGQDVVEGGGSQVPLQLGTSTSWTALAAGAMNPLDACVLDTSNLLWCSGPLKAPWLAFGTSVSASLPAQVGTGRWLTVSSDSVSTCGLQADGTLWCWGITMASSVTARLRRRPSRCRCRSGQRTGRPSRWRMGMPAESPEEYSPAGAPTRPGSSGWARSVRAC
jgi:alpha-tubulin suppressor-like RCC1 family protein